MSAVNFFRWFTSLMLQGVKWCFNTLDNFYIYTGLSLLDFMIACIVISVVIPVFFTVARAGYSNAKSEIKYQKRMEERRARKGGKNG